MRQMTMFAQRVCSMLVGAFFVGAFAFTVLATSPAASHLPSPRSTFRAPRAPGPHG